MINVLFFARLREQLQCEKLTIQLSSIESSDIEGFNIKGSDVPDSDIQSSNIKSADIKESAITVSALKAHLVELHPTWLPHFENTTLLSAINQSMVSDTAVINQGDEVAFFPPVTGG